MSVQNSKTEAAAKPPEPIKLSPVATAARIGEMVIRETLTPLLLLDLVAHGDLSLVERSLAAVSGFDERTVQSLLHDRGYIGLRTLFRAAGFDLRHLSAIHTALTVLREVGGSIPRDDRYRHAERCLSRFLTAADHLPPETLDEVLGLLVEIRSARIQPADQIRG